MRISHCPGTAFITSVGRCPTHDQIPVLDQTQHVGPFAFRCVQDAPKEAGTLARRLAVCGDTITKHIEHSGMNYGELRTKVHEHFTEVLKKAKARRDELGPYTELERKRIADTIRLHEADNEDFWGMMQKGYAT